MRSTTAVLIFIKRRTSMQSCDSATINLTENQIFALHWIAFAKREEQLIHIQYGLDEPLPSNERSRETVLVDTECCEMCQQQREKVKLFIFMFAVTEHDSENFYVPFVLCKIRHFKVRFRCSIGSKLFCWATVFLSLEQYFTAIHLGIKWSFWIGILRIGTKFR